jgi:hypothetical protein
LLNRAFQIDEEDTSDTVHQKIEQTIITIIVDSSRILPYIGECLVRSTRSAKNDWAGVKLKAEPAMALPIRCYTLALNQNLLKGQDHDIQPKLSVSNFRNVYFIDVGLQ